MSRPTHSNDDKQYWLDEPRNVSRIFFALVALFVVLELAGFFFAKHGHFFWEEWPGFYGLYGFGGSVFLVLAARQLRKLLMRDEDYYDR